jgi:hypothetical protein
MKKKSLSYVELSDRGCNSIVLENLQVREEVYGGASAPVMSDKDSLALSKAIIKLFQTVAVKKKSLFRQNKEYKSMDYIMTMTMRGSASQHDYIVPTEFVKAFVKMYDAMAVASKNTYKSGKDKGKNLLLGLTDGSYTINDFNKLSKSKNEEED